MMAIMMTSSWPTSRRKHVAIDSPYRLLVVYHHPVQSVGATRSGTEHPLSTLRVDLTPWRIRGAREAPQGFGGFEGGPALGVFFTYIHPLLLIGAFLSRRMQLCGRAPL